MELTLADKDIIKDFAKNLSPEQKQEIKKALDELDRKYCVWSS